MSDPVPSPAEQAAERALALLGAPARLAAAVRERRDAAAIDLFRKPNLRLSDRQIAVMHRMLLRLVGTIEDELRGQLASDPRLAEEDELLASLASERVPIAIPILQARGLLLDSDIVAALLRRVDQFSFVNRLGDIHLDGNARLLESLVDGDDAGLVEAARAMLVAEARANDRFGDPVLSFEDLDADLRERIIWKIAAALRDYGLRHHQPNAAVFDIVVEDHGRALRDRAPADLPVDQVAMTLVDQIGRAGRLDDRMLAEALGAGRLSLYAAMLAARAEVGFSAAWDMAVGGDTQTHALLLRAADVEAAQAAALVEAKAVDASDQEGDPAAAAMAGYRHLSGDDARAALYPWRFDRGYRRAVDAIGSIDGGPGQ